MRCPYCSATDTRVLESRESTNADSIRRRRECDSCGKRFTTYERVDFIDLSIVKKDGRREGFSRDKLLKSMITACQKRPVTREAIEASVSRIESQIRRLDKTEVKSSYLGNLVMKHLHSLDEVAYVRFASVYKKFKDVQQFAKEITRMKNLKKIEKVVE